MNRTERYERINALITELEVQLSIVLHANVTLDVDFTPTKEMVIREVCQEFAITEDQLKGPSKEGEVMIARLMCYKLLKECAGLNSRESGDLLGGRSQSTVRHGIEACNNYIDTEERFRLRYRKIESFINHKISNNEQKKEKAVG